MKFLKIFYIIFEFYVFLIYIKNTNKQTKKLKIMNKVTNVQISVLYDMFIDNGLILVEAHKDHIVSMDKELIDWLTWLVEYNKQILIDAENNIIDFIELNDLILDLISKAKEIRDIYSNHSIGYPYFNSIYDRTKEGYIELANTL